MNNAVKYTGLVQRANHQDDSISQVQSDIYRAVIELPKLGDIVAELEKLRFRLNDDQKPRWAEDQDFLGQISTLDFTSMQKEAYSKRYGGTGQWVLESLEFQTWFKSENGQHSVLWCPGNPGVGKTVVTSIAVNHVIEYTSEQNTAVVYVYCDYGNASTFSVENLLGSLVRQLAAQTSHAETIAELKTTLAQTTKRRNMTERELSSWTETLSRTFDAVYTFVDALDECPEDGRDSLLLRLQQYGSANMRVFLTSRLNVDVRDIIPHAIRVEISATKHDVTNYVEAKIQKSRRLKSLTDESPELKRHIIESVVRKADGMFLLAGLQTESLGNQTCVRGVRSALERLPTHIFTMYDLTIKRICVQSTENAELGLKVLSMVFGATRPLGTDELRHALAIQPGDRILDSEALAKPEILLSVTAGLVITKHDDYHGQHVFRLVHYTLQEYLKINQERLFPNLELDMASACLAYLSLDEINGDKRRDNFLYYAAHHWVTHFRGVQMELMDHSLAFIRDSKKLSAWLQYFKYNEWSWIDLSSSHDILLDPVSLAAHFHLSHLFMRLISSQDINTRNKGGETALLRAVDVVPWMKSKERPFHHFQDADLTFLGSLDADQYAMVQVILDLDADIDAKDPLGMTAAFRAVDKRNRRILSLLLDRGADIDAQMHGGKSLLHFAIGTGQVDIVLCLLGRGGNVNVLTEERLSLVHAAAIFSNSAILEHLLDSGAPFDVANEDGMTPLMFAAGKGRLETVTELIKRGARCDSTDHMGRTSLHYAVLTPNTRPESVEVIMRTQEVDVVDTIGRTPLHYAYFRFARTVSICGSGDEHWETAIADVIRLLIEGGASETVVDAYGNFPKDYSDWSNLEREGGGGINYWEFAFWEGPTLGKYREIRIKGLNDPTASLEPEEESREEQRGTF